MISEVSLYIPTYNSAKYLPEVMPSVFSQTYPIAEILVIDGCSNDGTVELVKKLSEDYKITVRIIAQPPKKGLADARNIAFRHCKTKYLASVDADVVLTPSWLENIMSAFKRYDNIAGICGTLKERYTKTVADKWRASHLNQSWGKGEFSNVKFVFGSNNLYVCQDVVDAGLFNSKLIFAGEDYDISMKLKKIGKDLLYTDSAQCEHLREDNIKSILNTIWRYNYYGGQMQEKGWLRHLISPAVNGLFCTKLACRDIFALRFGNLFIDFLCWFYLTYMDLKSLSNV